MDNKMLGVVILVIGFLIFLFLSMFFGGFIMIVGAVIALISDDKKEKTDVAAPGYQWPYPPEQKK